MNIEQLNKANKEITELKAELSLADAIINNRVDNDIKIKAQINPSEEIAELNLTIIRMKHTLEVIASNPGWNDHHCRAMTLLEEYSEHNKLREQSK